MKKWIIGGSALVAVGLVGVVAWQFLGDDATEPQQPEVSESSDTTTPQNSSASESPAEPNSIRILAVGDMLPHDTVNLRAETGDTYDYTPFFNQVSPHMQGDIVFCNQESPSAGPTYGITGFPTFNAPTEFARDLNQVGCNVIGLANNHMADKGAGAIDATLDYWDTLNPLAVSGANRTAAEQNEISYFEVRGTRFAFVAFTDHQNNNTLSAFRVNVFSESLVNQLVSEAAANSDYVLISAHWGSENSDQPNAAQQNWAQTLADAGADFVFGSGPHVLQPVERIGDTYVAYSLGNFLSTQLTIDQLIGGILIIDIPLTEGESPRLSFTPTFMSYEWTEAERNAEDLLARDNLQLIPLNQADSALQNSLFNTTATEQEERAEAILNQEIIGGVQIVY